MPNLKELVVVACVKVKECIAFGKESFVAILLIVLCLV